MNSLLGYRRDIDGLRAIAVLPVVLFHLGVAPFSGGFVGVDVFFVISGFLITSIVYREQQAGTFSYARFYERRIRRLFPALAVMLLVTGAVAWFVLLPEDYKLFSEAQGLSVLFLANIHFWNKTDYFNDAVANIPLLHTWSLSVEEQFYLLFPPLLLLLVKRCPKRVNLALFGLAVLSLLAAQKALSSVPESAFYLVHLRAWELLAGALLATGALPPLTRRVTREAMAWCGLALILFSVFWLSKDRTFPGLLALPAVAGAAMVIHAGMHGDSSAAKLLGWRPLVWVGLISYSLYLWHWPLFVFAAYLQIVPFSAMQQLALLLLSLLLGWASWRFVEAPFRHSSGVIAQRKRLFQVAGAVALVLVAISLPGIITKGASFRMPPDIVAIQAVEEEKIPFKRPCFSLEPSQVDQDDEVCALGVDGEPSFLLWGDSHSLSLAYGMDLAAKAEKVSGRFLGKSVCPPALGTQDFMASEEACSDFNDAVVRYLDRHPSIEKVVLVGVWFIYDEKSTGPADTGFDAGFERALRMLNDKGIDVSVVLQVPNIAYNVPATLARIEWYGSDLDIRSPRAVHLSQTASFREQLKTLADQYRFTVLNLDDVYCDAEYCNVQLDGQPIYRDSHHLSKTGSRMAVAALQNELASSPKVNGAASP